MTIEGDLAISCPVGVGCDENYLYRAYVSESEDYYLYLSFEPSVVGATSFEQFVEGFTYANVRLLFPELATSTDASTSTFYFDPRVPVEDPSVLTGFSDRRLSGVIHLTMASITEKITSSSLDCVTDDIIGLCYKDHPVDSLPIEVRFDLRVPVD